MIRLVAFLQGVSATLAWISAALFLRYWRESRERLLALFALAFLLLGASWAALSIFNPVGDGSPYIYVLRLVAFLLIIAGVIDKNREKSA